MKVELLHHTPLWVASDAIRTCWASQGKSDTVFFQDEYYYEDMTAVSCKRGEHDDFIVGGKDYELIERIGNQFKHKSTLEHLTYNFHISDISRALLQELARHRMASLSVKSTRYTLKELKSENEFNDFNNEFDFRRASKYLKWTGTSKVDSSTFYALEDLRKIIVDGTSNDIAKYAIPENYKTELAWTINARSLQNFLELRTSKAALEEIRDLANLIYERIPEDHQYLFTDSINS